MTGLVSGLRAAVPSGVDLDPEEFWHRHRVILALLALHLPVLLVGGLRTGTPLAHLLGELAPVALATAVAGSARVPRRLRAVAATLGLVAASAIVVHLSGGIIEAHFHFLVVVSVVLLYHDWVVFLAALGFVLVHHGVMGVLDPWSVYNHPAAIADPVRWAAIHAAAVAAISGAGIVNWRFNEVQRARADASASSLEVAYRELQHALAAKDELLARVSHELRTPLTVVSGFAQALASKSAAMDDETRVEAARAIVRNGDRLEELIAQLLDVARLEEGVAVPEPVDVRVSSLVQQAVAAAGPGTRPRLVVGGDVTVYGDREQLVAVLANLLRNAARYGEPPVTITAGPSPDGWVEVVVSDAGRGVPAAFVPRLFERFEQASTGDKRDATGMGLGLHLVRTLVERNHGRVVYEPAEGGGASFVLQLPAGDVQATPAGEVTSGDVGATTEGAGTDVVTPAVR